MMRRWYLYVLCETKDQEQQKQIWDLLKRTRVFGLDVKAKFPGNDFFTILLQKDEVYPAYQQISLRIDFVEDENESYDIVITENSLSLSLNEIQIAIDQYLGRNPNSQTFFSIKGSQLVTEGRYIDSNSVPQSRS